MAGLIVEKSNAKINLGLSILEKRDDGYHNLDTIFAELDWGDVLEFSPAEKYKFTVESSIQHPTSSAPADETNLITQAYRLLRSMFENVTSEYAIHLKKQIPIGAGLGGGSSNAAATLRALNKLWNVGLSDKVLEMLGKKLGADVPFFIRGGVQRGKGIGEKLSHISFNEDWWFVVCVPEIFCSTAHAFRDYKKHLPVNYHPCKFTGSNLVEKELLPLKNDFEPMVFENYSEIEKTKSLFKECGAFYASLSGSGSAVYGVFHHHETAKNALSKLDSSSFSFLTQIIK
ncbi:MAG: 4-(cytidine 5'-diphospho)-2-C-methyl-D-erythritol kinase [Candidatus Marinimicrobia bacterium]|nr:4-(cytidine 5'-diphospho)-2-C-methyl-D-erythritol kinase [Candidatus Neomarinimicrobiota bacterium]